MRRLFGVSSALLIVLCFTAYYPTLKGFFASDDFDLISRVSINGPFGVWTIHDRFLRPVISLSLFTDHWLWGLNPMGYKFTNVSAHALNSILVMLSTWLLTSRLAMARSTSASPSVAAGIMFALLPAHAEAVSWISGRTDVICTFFSLGAWCTFLLYDEKEKPVYLVASPIAFSLALLSKEAALTLPLIMGLYVVYLHMSGQQIRRVVRGLAANAVILLFYLPLRYFAVGGIGGYGANVHLALDPVRWIAGPPIFLARIIWPGCWPSNELSSMSSLSERVWFMRWFYLAIGLLFVVGIVGAAFSQHRKGRMGWGVVVFLLAAGVIAQLPSVTIGLQAETSIGERFVYLPSVFICSLIAIVFVMVAPLRYYRPGILLLAIVYGVTLWRANLRWYESGEIAKDILSSMRTVNPSRPVSVILPDHLKGALIFRNGIQPAADLFGVHGQWKAIALVTLDSRSDRFILGKEGGKYTVKRENPRSAIISVLPPATDVTISSNNEAATIAVTDVLLAHYSEGRLQVAP